MSSVPNKKKLDLERYVSSPHIGVSSRRTGVLLEDIYLNRKDFSRKVFLRCQHYSTALQVLERNSQTMLTIPKQILSQLSLSSDIQVFDLPIELPNLNMGIYWHVNLKENLRHIFLRDEISKIFA